MYVATSLDGCGDLGAEYISLSGVEATAEQCKSIGGQVNSTKQQYCDLHWCRNAQKPSGALHIR